MFTYCGNNPVSHEDSTGYIIDDATNPNAMMEGGYGPFTGYVYFPEVTLFQGTISLGVAGNAYCGYGAEGAAGLVIDGNGHAGAVFTGGAGAGTASTGVSGYVSYTTAPDISKLRGRSEYVGSSVSFLGISVGFEYSIFNDDETGKAYHGYTVSFGAGSPIPFETHGGVAWSTVFPFWDVDR